MLLTTLDRKRIVAMSAQPMHDNANDTKQSLKRAHEMNDCDGIRMKKMEHIDQVETEHCAQSPRSRSVESARLKRARQQHGADERVEREEEFDEVCTDALARWTDKADTDNTMASVDESAHSPQVEHILRN